MAESQISYPYHAATITALKASLSEPRFGSYLAKASNNEHYAIALYLYNARLAKSFLFPLNVAEITLRNAVDCALVQKFGPDWHTENNFRDRTLSEQSRAALEKAITRASAQDRGKVIAELTFDFWSNLFRVEYASVWRTMANIAFPELPHGQGRREVQTLVREINQFRNRVAHHEPILDVNVPDLHSKMIKLVKLRCEVTADWMKHHSTVSTAMRSRPNLAGSAPVTLGDRTDTAFAEVHASTTLAELNKSEGKTEKAIVCTDSGNFVGAFTQQILAQYITEKAGEADGLIDLNDHTVGDVLKSPGVKETYHSQPARLPFFDAVEILKRPKAQLSVALDEAANAPQGVILRAHRRY